MELKTIILKEVSETLKNKVRCFLLFMGAGSEFSEMYFPFWKLKGVEISKGNRFQSRNDRLQCYKWLKWNNGNEGFNGKRMSEVPLLMFYVSSVIYTEVCISLLNYSHNRYCHWHSSEQCSKSSNTWRVVNALSLTFFWYKKQSNGIQKYRLCEHL